MTRSAAPIARLLFRPQARVLVIPLFSLTEVAMGRHWKALLLVCLAAIGSPAAHAADAVAWRASLDAAKIEAAQTNRLILLHFYTKTCGPCRILDQEVFAVPPVAAALEQDFVPVKIDADASPAIASAYRIDRVPTDVVLTPQGNILNMQGCPSTGEAYVGQLAVLARHFKQTTLASGQASPQPNVNAAYANLPVSATASVASTTVAPTQQQLVARQNAAAQRAATAGQRPPAPQAQGNPYVTSPPPAAMQAPPTGAPASAMAGVPSRPAYPQSSPTNQPLFTGPGAGSTTQPQSALAQAGQAPAPNRYAAAPSAAQSAPGSPTMPANAMPNSYRAPNATTQAAAAVAPSAALAAGALQAGVPNAAAVPPQRPTAAPASQPPASYPTATVEARPTPPAQPSIPAGSPPLAFDGCCPVTLKTLKRWTVGTPAFGAVHRGRTYLFVGAPERDQFLADPDGYSPVFSGMDPVKLLDEQKLTPGSRKYGFEVGGRFYLFSSAETMEKFRANFPSYTASVRQAMNRLDAGSDVIRR